MGFEAIGVDPRGRRAPDPQLTIYLRQRRARFNVAAYEAWCDGVETVVFHVDHDAADIGIELDAPLPDAYRLSEADGGASTSCTTLLDALSLTDVDETVRLDLEYDPDEGLLVADATPLLEVAGDA